MGGTEYDQVDIGSTICQLRRAVRDLRIRGLKYASKFVSELLLGVPEHVRNHHSCQEMNDDDKYDDIYEAAKASFDLREYLRVNEMLKKAPKSKKSQFLQLYSLYLSGEKAKEEQGLEAGISGPMKGSEQGARQYGSNPYLRDLFMTLNNAYFRRDLDAFGLYLFAIVLRQHGMDNPETKEAHRNQIEPELLSINRATKESSKNITARQVLVESIAEYPWNWSAWMELSSLSPFISQEEETVLSQTCIWMFQLFQVHILLEQQQNEGARQLLDHLTSLFPESVYLLSQKALASYHMRDFDQAHDDFERLMMFDPYRVENMDVYSNILYVKEDKTELSRLAHRSLQVEKYCPETCCIIGNYYSLKAKHDRAILYFQRALRLDPNFLSAWTLIGHEYVEMKNTSAAIEAYRRAVDLNSRDYRAWYGLGQAYEILNMYFYSVYYYRKAASIRPYDARMWCALGGCYEKLGKSDEAIGCFKRAVANQDREGIASYHLGRIFALRNEQHDAAKYYLLHLGLGEDVDIDHVDSIRTMCIDSPQALAAVLFLANYFKQHCHFKQASLLCNRLLDLQGPEKEEAKALLREIRSLEVNNKAR